MDNDVLDAAPTGHFDGSIRAAVIHNQQFNLIHSVDVPRNVGHGFRQRLFFVKTRNLHN
jgi:hypothetical protein